MAKKQLRDFLAGVDNAAEIELKVREALEAEGCKIFIDDGKDNIYVPKSRLDNKIAELATANDTIQSLQDKVKGKDAADEKIKALEGDIEKYKTDAKNMQLKNAINLQALEAKAKDADDLMKFLDVDKITIGTDGKVIGLKEQIEALQKSKSYLFEESEPDDDSSRGQDLRSFFGTGSPGKPSNLNAFGSKTTHEGDFGKLLGQKVTEEAEQIDSNYFFKKNE